MCVSMSLYAKCALVCNSMLNVTKPFDDQFAIVCHIMLNVRKYITNILCYTKCAYKYAVIF